MIKQKYAIGGMSCAACAARVEKAAGSLDGVESCQVNLLQNTMQLCCDESKVSPALVEAAVKSAGYSARLCSGAGTVTEDEKALLRQKRSLILSFGLTFALMTVSMGPMLGLVLISDALYCALVQAVLALAVMLLQRQYFIRGFKALWHRSPNMDSLVALGSAVSFLYSLIQLTKLYPGLAVSLLHGEVPLYFESAATILCLVGIGKYFEHKAKVKSTQAVSSLIDLSPKLVRVRRDEQDLLLSPDAVHKGDLVILKTGESLGADGIVVSGAGFMDESSLTGESLAQKKGAGSKVLSGTLLTQGYLEIEAQAVGADTTFSRILQLMDETLSQKVPIARLADTIAYYFVPAVITLAIITGVIWLNFAPLAQALNFALCVLVVSCPCALGLATPTALMVGMGRAAKLGILFRNAAVLEVLNQADTVIFDKTGTLTCGQLQLLQKQEARPGLDTFAALLMFSLESKSSHPLAAALVRSLGAQVKNVLALEDYQEHEGQGISAFIAGTRYYAGNISLVSSVLEARAPGIAAAQELSQKEEAAGHVVLHLCSDKELLCSYVLGDEIKKDAKALVERLQQRGLKCLMFTGDRQAAAAYVSNRLGLDGFKAELLAADKLTLLKQLQADGHKVVMLGDGVNDTLCLSQADVGVGVHGASDIAVSACDLILMNERLLTLDSALALSALTYRNIKENLFWAFIYNVLTIPLAAGLFFHAFGLMLNPMLAALLMSLSSLCVVSNALRLNFVKLGNEQIQVAVAEPASFLQEKKMKKEILIEGMHCSHCTSAVLNALSALPGATDVTVSLEEKRAAGDFDSAVSDEMIKGVISALGFKVSAVNTLS